jgi:glycerol-3-phosphate dehydrogenase
MKRIAIIGAGSVGMAIHKVLNAQMSNAEFVVVDNIEEAQRVV